MRLVAHEALPLLRGRMGCRERGALGDIGVTRDAEATGLVEKQRRDAAGVGLMTCRARAGFHGGMHVHAIVARALPDVVVTRGTEGRLPLGQESVDLGGVRDMTHVALLILEGRMHGGIGWGRGTLVAACAQGVRLVEEERRSRRCMGCMALVAATDLDGNVRPLLREPRVRFVVTRCAEHLSRCIGELWMIGAVCKVTVEAASVGERRVDVGGIELCTLCVVAAQAELFHAPGDEVCLGAAVRRVTEPAALRRRGVLRGLRGLLRHVVVAVDAQCPEGLPEKRGHG